MTTPEQDIEANQNRIHTYRRKIESAIGQASCDFGTEMHKRREEWTPAQKEQFERMLEPFAENCIWETVHAAVLRSRRDANSCILAEFSEHQHGKDMAPQAAHRAAWKVAETGFKTQVRRYGDVYQVKLLDV